MTLVKPNRPQFLSLDAMMDEVHSGDCISIGGHHFARLPMAMIRTLAARNLKDLHYLSWAGGLPLEFLLEAGAVSQIDICFSSLDIFGLAPRFRKAVEGGTVPMNDWPALALINAFRAREQNLPFLPMQKPEGSAVSERCPALRPWTDPVSGRDLMLVEAREIDVFLMHAARADTSGNIEIYGAHALDKVQAGAARKVLVTVEEIVPVGQLNRDGRGVVIPRNKVSAIATVPGGAYPCSCLPYYTNDWAALRKLVEAKVLRDAADALGNAVPDRLRLAAKAPRAAISADKFLPAAVSMDAPATVDEIMAVRIARTLDNDSYASAGAVSPLGNVAYRFAKMTHAPDMIITTLSGGHVDIAAGPMSLSLVEAMDVDSAVQLTGGEDTYWVAYQGGFVTSEIVGTAQIDAQGRTNTLEITKPSGGLLRLPGQGGMSDVANMHRDFVVYVPRHSASALVETVEVVSAARGIHDKAARIAAGYRPGDVMVFTNLCVFRYDDSAGQLVVTEIMPDVTREDIVQNTGFKVVFHDDCGPVAEPTQDDLYILRHHVDPIGLRRLEFVSARDRVAVIDDVLARDAAALQHIAGDVRPS
ncbi:CoA-transferase [Flavimaricola marinus]|uniref:3-oxoadipate CoA-transferase subunit B n=1 Tax=Flavimaricola marinus TaxID=1819565 RepID=A0A238LLM4_9RHOB|nr:CoA-transferase [Flavimaricola marinus]SMY09750.1 3-oxoadipate CoA-transferase subunit B [Flavimaricola marinus]